MPTIQNSTRGQVVQIWGKAYIRGTDGVWRPLAVGEVVPQGAEILTEQNAIVMMTRGETPLPKIAESAVDRAVAAIENNEEPPAAGLQGGGSGDLQPGLRVDRIVESVTPASIDTRLEATPVEFGVATQSDPGASAIGAPRLIAASSSIAAVEAGGSVSLGLARPSGPGTLTITVTTLPVIGQVFTAAGTPVVAGTVLTAEDLAGLIYRPPVDYTAGTPVGTFGYSVSNGIDSVNGGTRIAVTPVNDAPLAIDDGASGGEDILLDVSLRGIDIDGAVASVTVRTPPANGTLLLRDTLAPFAVGTLLTPAQAASLVFRPNANWNGSTSLTFTVTDNEGAVSAPATVQLQITPVNDPPLAVNDSTSTVAQAPVTVAVLGNDSDADNDTLTVTSASVAAALGTVVDNGDGTLTFTAAPGVTGAVVISYTITDPSGATSSATLTVNVAATPAVTVDAPALTNDTTPTLTGSSNLPPGSTVTLTVTGFNGTVQTFTTTVRADGTYSVDVPAALAEGPYTVVANVNGPGGTTATANDNGVIDITPPVITVDAPALTNDSTPALTGTTDLPAGSTITLTVNGANGVSQLFTTTVQAGGVFSIDVPAALVSGPFSVSARGSDAAGNSATATDNGVVDTMPPAITVDAPALTNDTTPALTGTTDLPVGSTVTLTVTGANGAAQTFTTTVQAGGVFSVSVPAALVEGNFSVSASGTDAAGNTATASDSGVIDNTAPTITVDAPALTNDTTPPLTGTTNLPAGSTVALTVTGANGAVQTFNATVQAGGTFSVDVPAALVQGNFIVTATATDAAGNSASASDTGLIDTTPPVASITIDPVTADNIVNAGEASSNITITGSVGGDVQVGNTVTINVNGVNYSGLVLAGNTFAISVPGSAVLADADRRIDGSVITTDAAGNSTTATAQRPYAVNSAPIAVNDTLSVGEDTSSASSDVTPGTPAQDRDADGDTLTVIGVATGVQPSASGNVNTPISGTWGTLLLDGLGAYTYAPSAAAQALDPGQTVTDTFTYTISDGRGGSATATLTISVVGANDPTTISGVFIGTVTEDAVATASGTLANNDPDVGTRAFVVQTNSAGTYGRFSIDAAGDWTYTLTNAAANVQALAQGQNVTETFIVATDDGTTASITVTVNGANDAPVVSSTSINAVEEGAAVALGLAVPSDIDNGAVLTITVSGLPAIGQVQLANGTAVANGAVLTAAQLAGLRYLPPTDYDGVAPVGTFAYSVSDGIASVNGGTTINVAAVNDRPVAIDVSASGVEDSATRVQVTLAGSDVDGTVVSYTLTSLPASGDLYAAATGGAPLAVGAVITGPLYFVPRADFNGSTGFGYTATDNSGAVSTNTATATITIAPVNDAPVLGGVAPSVTFVEDGTTTVTPLVIDSSVLFADIDSANLGGGSLTVAIGNVVAGQDLLDLANQGAGAGQISISGSNVLYNPGSGAVVIGTFTGGSSGAPLTVNFNTSATPAAVDALIQNLRYTNTSQWPDTTPRNLTITVVDGDGGTDTVSVGVTVNITSTNDAPTFTALGGTVSFSEGGAAVVLDGNATLNDVELGSGFNGSLNNLGGATLTLVRNSGANADDVFSGSGTLSLSGGNVVLGGLTVGSYNATALANGSLQITFANGTTTAQADSVLQQIAYENTSATPPPSLTVGYVFSDANSGTQGVGGALSASGSVTVNIGAFNNPPGASNDSETTGENTPLSASVPAATDVDGTIASYALASSVGAGNGALVFNSDGTFTFNPGSDFDGLAVGATRGVTFTYTATDNGGAVSAPATVTITVTGANDGPLAFNASQTTGENSTLNSNVPAATDIDGTVTGYTLAGSVGANNGTLTFNSSGAYVFATGTDFDSLAVGQSRDVTFTYTATDNDGAVSAPATVTITVTGANDAPTGADASYTITEDGSRAFAGADFGFTDIDVGDTLAAVRIDSLPAAGTLTLNGTPVTTTQVIAAADLGNLVFTPLANASGAPYAAFTFSVQDNGGLFDAAPNAITFNVTPVNDPPVAVVTPASGDEDTPIAVSLTGTDIDGAVTAITVTVLPGNGTLVLADGITPVAANTPLTTAQAASLIFQPAADFNGVVNLTFTVTDNSGAISAPAVLPITVAPVVDPAISIGDVSVNEGAGTVTFTVTLDQPTTATVSVNFATSDGTATSGADYTAGSGTLSFAPGVTTRTVTVPIADDGTFEGNETFNVVLTGAVNATIADATGLATITDNDTPTLAVSSPTVAEGGFAVFTVSLSNTSTTAVTFNPTLASGTATVGTDTSTALEYFDGTAWVAVPVGGVTIAAGSTSVQVRVATTDDVAAEGAETFALTATVTAGTTANASASGTATISDDIDATPVTLTATPSVAEGGSIVYTATLTSAAVTPMAVTLSSGQTINIAAGANSGALTIAAPGEDPYLDAGSVSRTIVSTSGGGFEAVTIDPAAAVTSVTDTIDTTAVSITGDAVVAEGATASYTVSLTSPAQTAVTVTLAYSGTAADGTDLTGVATVTIPAGSSSANFNIATLQDALAEGAENFTVTIASAAGGNFESLVISGANGAQTTSITDDDTPTLSVSSPSVTEGSFAVFTVSLSNPSTTAVTFNPALASGTATVGTDTATALEYFNGSAWVAVPVGGVSIAAGSTSVQVRVATTDDFAAEGDETFALSATVTSGNTGNASASGTATITDDVDATTVRLTATPSVAEGGSIIYTATLTSAAVTPMTVTLFTGQTINIAAGATSGSVSIAAPGDDPYVDAGSVSATIASTSGGGFEAVTIDPASATTTITDTSDTTSATLTATPSVAEGATITYTVSLAAPVTGSPVTVTLANGQAINIAVGSSSGSATTAVADNVYAGGGSVSNNIASISGGNFEQLTPDTAPVSTTVTDDGDVTTVSLSATASVVEGGSIVYTATLTNAAQSPVTITLSNGATITIAAGATSGTATVAAPGDDPYLDASTVNATISTATGGNFESLQIDPTAANTSVTDDSDPTTVSLSATASVAEGGSIVYTAALTNAAQTPVTVTLSTGQTITIAAGSTTGSVSILAPTDDIYVDAGIVSRTITAASGGNFESLVVNPAAASTTVTDTIDATTVSITGDAVVAEGATASYTVSLNSAAQTAVTVNLSYSGTAADGTDFTGVASVTIPAGSSSAALNIATLQDALAEGAENFTVTIGSAAGGNFENLVISAANGAQTTSIIDDDTPVLSVSSPTVGEGGFAVFTVSLSNASTTAVTFNPTLSSGSATIGTDTSTALEYFDGSSWVAVAVGGVTLAAGTTSAQVRVATTDDFAAESDETFALTATVTAGTTANASASGTATISDDADATTVSLTATPSVAEGGSIIYTATLGNAAVTAMTVTLSNGATITIAAGATSGSTAVAAPSDDVYVDAGSVSATIASTSGGGFEAVTISPASATTSISDTIDTTTATLTATPSVAEGGAITYTVSLAAPVTGSAVIVTLAGGQTITIPVGAASGTATGSAPDDVFAGGGSVSNNIASISGGNFEQLTPDTAPVTTTVTDDGDVTTVTLTATPSVVEGSSITYTATLTNAAQAPVTITLSNGATIGIAAGASSGSATVAAPGDDPYVDASTVSATISTATGGNFESLQIDPAAANTSVTDDVDATTVSLTATASVAEGGSIVYTATLTNAVQTPVSVTLSTGETITIAAGATSGSVSIVAPGEDVYVDASTVSRTISTATGGNFESLNVDATAATTTVTDTVDTTTATLTATPSVVEGGTITWTASLTAPVTGSDVTVTLAGGQVITIAAGASSGTATGTAPDDVFAGGGSVANNIASISGGNFEQLTPNTAPVTTTITDDADATTVTLTATPSVVEGGSIVYTAALTNAAQTPVTVTLSNGTTISIAAGATSGFVSAAAPSDDPYLDAGNVATTISSATGGGFEQLDVNLAPAVTSVTDDVDATTVSLGATASVAEGGSIVYTATLSNAAQTPVTVTLSSGETITITAGATSGSVSILAPTEDVYIDGSTVSRTISSASGGNFESLNVDATAGTTTVTDTIDTTTVSITGDAAVAEGATAAYTVSLTSAAQTAVTVNLSYSGTAIDGTDFTGVATVTIAAGSSSAGLNIATLADVLAEGVENFTVTIASAAGGNFENLVISSANGALATAIIDDDTPALSVSSPSVGEGGFAVFTVSLSNASTTAVTFNPTLASGSATVGTDTASALEYFDGSTWVAVPVGGVIIAAGSTSVQLRVATTDDVAAEGSEAFTLTATVTAGTTANASATGTATITDDADVTTVTLSATPSVAEGGNIIYTATLSNAAVTPMTVTLSSGQTISIVAGSTTGSVSIAAPGDDPYIDAGSVSRTIASTSGGGFESLSIDSTAATTSVTDTVDTTTATLTATPSVAEGGTITYTVGLTAAVTGSAVSVLLANGQTVTIPVGASSGSVTAVAPDNVYGGGASVANSIVSASGGNYEQLTPNTTPVATAVTDDGDVTTVSLAATASVVEGTAITYTAALTNAAQTVVNVTLSNGATINIAAGATSGSTTVAAPGDDPYVDASTVSATIATATGGNFENLQIDPAAANTTVTDDSDPTTLDLSATASVAEGGSIVYTATLTNAAQTPLTVTLSTGETIAIAAGATSGSVSIAAPSDDVFVDAGSVTRSITATSGGNFENLQVGTASATTAVSDTIDVTTVSITGSSTVAEGATASYTVSLTSPAQTAVTVNLTYSGTAADGSDYTGVASVTIPAGANSASFNVATLQDAIGEGAENFTVTIASAAGGNFESLVISGANGAQTTSITDDDTPTLAVSSPTVGEGGFAVFTVSLSNASTTAVTFNPTLASSTATVGTDTSTALEVFNGSTWVAVPGGGVTLAAGSTSVQVRVATTDDFAAEGSETFSLTATVTTGTTGNASATGTATITDDVDSTSLTLTATASVAEGGTITYTATLTNAAVTPMTVTLSTGQTISIAAGATSGSVSIAAPGEDPYVDASTVSRTISSTSGGGFEALTVDPAAAATTVTDTIDTTTLSISGSASVTEGAPGTYTVSLTSLAQTAVTVNLTYSGTAANGVDFTGVATVTIAAGSSSATFNIATIDDLIDEVAAESFTVSVASASGGNFENLVVSGSNGSVTTSITDNDNAPTIAVSSPTVAEAGGFAQFTLSLSNPSSTATTASLALANGTATSADYGPALEISTDGGTTWTSATSATFAAGATSLLVRTPIASDALDEADETFTLTATRTAGTTSNASAVGTATITDDDATPTLAIDDVTVNETAGTATFTVTLSAASGQSVSVNVATSNGTASAGADYTAVPSTTLTFAPGVITQTITVPILDDGTYEGVESFNVLLSGAVNASIADGTGIATINDNDLPALAVSSPTVTEGGFAVFTVSLSNPSTTAVTFNPALASGTATVGTDTANALEYFNGASWVAVPVGGVTIAAGSTSVQVRVATTDDFAAEGSETFTLTATRTAGTTSNASAVGTATITDDSDTTTVSLTATSSVVEGGSITYTATLTNAAVTPLTVTLSTGQTINIAAGATSGSVSIAAPGDDPYIDAGTVSRTIGTTSGGGFEALTIDTTAAVTNVTDDSDATTVSLTATPSVAEGGTIAYTATLTNAAQTAVTVTLSSGQTITIVAGTTTGTVSIAAPGEDPYLDAGSVSRTITSASGGNFESLVVNPVAATTTVTDTIDTTTATLTATPSVAEGGTITYTVSLTAPVTGSTVTVTLAGGQTITIPVGSSSGTATATAPDNVYAGGGSVANNIASIGGGNFEQLTPNTATVTTTVTDDADVTTVTLTATASVVEGNNITYTATLTNAAQTAVTVTLSSGETITIAAGATSGTVSIAAPSDDPYIDAGNVSRTISTATGGGFESLAVNPAAAVTAVTDDTDATTLTLSATPSVVEGGSITYTATLTNAAQTAVTVTLSSGETITIAAGATTGTVSIAAPSDDVYIDASTVSRTISTATGGNFELLTINPAAASTTVTDDSDATTVTLTTTPSVVEGGTIVYTATLSNAAQTAVTVTLSSGQTISIAAGATIGTASIAAPGDDVYIDAGTVSRTISSASGGNFETLTVNPAAATTTVTDTINTTTLSIGGSATVTEGASGSYTVSLTSPAQTSAVTVNLTYSGTAANGADFTGVATVTIPVGSSSATFNIATIDDLLDEGAAESFTVSVASASGGNFENLAISGANGSVTTSITDNDPPPALSINDVTVNEAAGTMTFTVTLSAASGQNVSVNYGSSNGTAVAGSDYTSASGTLTFAPGVVSQTITVPITNDTVYEPGETLYVNLSTPSNATIADGLGIGTIIDNDTAPTVSTVTAASATEGSALVHTVTLTNASSTPTTLAYTLAGVTATAGVDYNTVPTFSNGVTLAGGVLTVPAGVTSFTVTVASIGDVIDEPNETYNLAVGGVTAVGTINDDDLAPTLSVGNVTVNEAGGFAVFSVNLSNPSSTATTVSLALANVSATGGGVDYGAGGVTNLQVSTDNGATWTNATTATIAANASSVLVRTPVIADAVANEPNETFTLTATRTAGTTANASAAGTGTIIEQDISITSASFNEGTNATSVNRSLTVTLTPAFGVTTTVPFTLGGTALSPADYGTLTFSNGVTASGGTITIPNGVASFTITIPVVRDSLDEADETVTVNIAGSTGTLTIVDDDATPTLAINDVSVNEAAGTATFTVTLSAASGQTVTVNYGMVNQTALSGADFTAVSGTLTFAPGTTTQTITVPILQDNVYEGSETFRINLSTPVNATIADGVGIGTILDNGTGSGGTDNDTPTLAVSSITVSDQSNGFATFVVSLSNPSTTATSVSLALANGTATGGGVDYGSATATNLQVSTDNGVTWTNATSATIAPNSSYVLVRTPIIGDVANEVSETFTLTATRTVGTTTNASASGVGTITDIYNGPDAINDAPSAMLQEDTPAQTTLAGNVILGGSGDVADTDPNNDTLRVTGAAAGNSLVTGLVALGSPLTVSGLYGNLVIQADGTYTYTLDNARIQTQNMIGGQVYNDVFSYRITDGNGGYDTATITVQATGTLDLTAITPQPVAIAADGLSGEYYGYNDTVVAGNRVHADDGTATSLGTGSNLESVEDITAIINGRNLAMGGSGNIVGTNIAGAVNAADVLFNVRTLNYGTTPVVSSDLGDNAAVAAGNALPPQDNISGSGTTTALANFLDQDAATARAQTGTPTGATVGTQTGLGQTTDALIRMTGFVYLERGNYDFRVTGDDGFRLRVGGETLIEFDGNQPPTTRTFSNVEVNDRISGLTSIELLYWEQGGNANLQFEFRPSDSTTWVPFSLDSIAFFSTANAPTLTDTRIQDIVETNVNQQYELRTGSVLDGDANTNTLTGAEGRDYIQGFGGDDILNGNGSADYLDGGIGNDVLNGGDGNDILVGGTGNDTMTGGMGDDIYRVDSAGDVVVELAGAGQGTDTVEIEAAYNVGTYAIGANIENALLLGAFNSNITGNAANNRITGNDGNNILIGGAGDDRILGGRGNDTLSGDAGPLAGGNAGKDIFEWNLADRGASGAPAIDRITDFTYSGSTTSSAVPFGDLVPQHTDVLDLRDLLSGESSTSLNTGATPNIGNLLNYIDFSVVGGETTIRISSTGGFAGGAYAAAQEDQRIVLTGVDLYGVTGTTTETELLQRLLANGTLVVD